MHGQSLLVHGRMQGSDGVMGSKPEGQGEIMARADKTDATRSIDPGLYIVATPIGNAADITLRALEVLGAADLVVCEDTRVTGKLFTLHGLKRPMQAYHEHNAQAVRPKLMARLEAGEALALVSDAGMPLVSDPGYRLVGEAVERGLNVTVLPGASAPTTALALSGLPSDRFLFAGFAPSKTNARISWFAELAAVPATLIFFESARRLAASLVDMREALGPRSAAVARELTKKFEEVRRGSLDELIAHYDSEGPPKGEIVVVVGPPVADDTTDVIDLDEALTEALASASLRDAVDEVVELTGLPRKEVYRRALDLQKGR